MAPRRGARRRRGPATTTWPTASAATPCSPTSCCTSPPSTAWATSSRSGCCTPTSRRAARSSTSTRSCRSPSRSGLDETEVREALADRRYLAAVQPGRRHRAGARRDRRPVLRRRPEVRRRGRPAGRAAAADPRARLGRRATRWSPCRPPTAAPTTAARSNRAASGPRAAPSPPRRPARGRRPSRTAPSRTSPTDSPGVERRVRRVAGAPAVDDPLPGGGVVHAARPRARATCRLKSLTSARPGQRSGQATPSATSKARVSTVSSPEAARTRSRAAGEFSPSVQESSGVPIQTPAAPATSAAAIPRPVAIPPAATTGRSVSVSTSCSSGSIARCPVCPPASVPCTTMTSTRGLERRGGRRRSC